MAIGLRTLTVITCSKGHEVTVPPTDIYLVKELNIRLLADTYCQQCIEIESNKQTRFPEGAEL